MNFFFHHSDVTIDVEKNLIEYHQSKVEPWRVTLIDTGGETQTGGRLKRVRSYLHADEPFCLTYGDGLADIDIAALIDFHRRHGKLATITAVTPPGRYGSLEFAGDDVRGFVEKPPGDQGFVNGGYFVLNPSVIDRIEGDSTAWEAGSLPRLAQDGELRAFRHGGFWHAMDSLRDKNYLEELWQSGRAPWRSWT